MLREEKRRTYDGKYPNAGVIRSMNRNTRSVWTIPTHPFPEAHFATFPEKLIETPIKAGCPQYVCKKCGKGREKIIEKVKMPMWNKTGKIVEAQGVSPNSALRIGGFAYNKWKEKNPDKGLGYSDCGCNAGWEGGIVLDIFMGAGTTAVVAKKQGKKYIGIELKQEYINMANKRLRKIPERLF